MFDQKAYNREYYQEHQEELKRKARRRYRTLCKNPEFRAKQKLLRELQHYGFPQAEVFAKTAGQCWFCGKKAAVVHHLDGDGRTNERMGRTPGKVFSRLVPACRACHMEYHRPEISLVKKTRANGYWSRHHAACVLCGRTDRRHEGHGLCINCAANERNRRKRSQG